MVFNEMEKKLIVVCKDELLANQMKKYVETNDDKDEENIVGVKDGTVKIVVWDEDVWLDNKKAGNIASKVLIIGDVKGSDKLLPIIDVKYDEFGIKYGWAGNQAILVANPKALKNENDYNAFHNELQKTTVSESFQKKVEMTGTEIQTEEKNANKPGKADAVINALFFPIGLGVAVGMDIKDRFVNKKKIEKQQYFFGLAKLYENHLAEFLG